MIGSSDPGMSAAPTNEWVETHGTDELTLPLLSARSDRDNVAVHFTLAEADRLDSENPISELTQSARYSLPQDDPKPMPASPSANTMVPCTAAPQVQMDTPFIHTSEEALAGQGRASSQ